MSKEFVVGKTFQFAVIALLLILILLVGADVTVHVMAMRGAQDRQDVAIVGGPDHTLGLVAPAGQMVPAYDDPAADPSAIVQFHSGERCLWLGGPTKVSISGKIVTLYDVRCGDNTVSVDAAYIAN
jgi:hypothetical protein